MGGGGTPNRDHVGACTDPRRKERHEEGAGGRRTGWGLAEFGGLSVVEKGSADIHTHTLSGAPSHQLRIPGRNMAQDYSLCPKPVPSQSSGAWPMSPENHNPTFAHQSVSFVWQPQPCQCLLLTPGSCQQTPGRTDGRTRALTPVSAGNPTPHRTTAGAAHF